MSRKLLCPECDKTLSALANKYSELYESVEGKANDFYNCDDCGITIHENDKCFASVLLPDKSHPNYEIQKPETWMEEYF